MTQHTQNLLLGFILGWCLRGVYNYIKAIIVRKIKRARLIKQSEEFAKWIETPEGQEYKKHNEWLE